MLVTLRRGKVHTCSARAGTYTERDEENVNSWNSHDAEMEQQLHSKFMLMPRPGINFFALSERHFDL